MVLKSGNGEKWRRTLWALGLVALAACGDSSGAPDQGNVQPVQESLPCNLQSVIAAKCQTCHGAVPTNAAPMSLVSYTDFIKNSVTNPSVPVWQQVQVRINSTDNNTKMPEIGYPQLTADELAAFNAWLAGGAQPNTTSCGPLGGGDGDQGGTPGTGGGTPGTGGGLPGTGGGDGDGDLPGSDGGTPGTGGGTPGTGGGTPGGGGGDGDGPTCPNGNCTIDTTGLDCYKLTAYSKSGDQTKPYEVGVARDYYVTFGFKAPWTGTAYGVVVKPIIDNMNAIHHWLLYDENVGSPGTTPVHSSGVHSSGSLVYGWAPGGDALDFRTQGDGSIGFEFQQGHWFSIEYHYNSNAATNTDASGVELCVTKTAPAHIAGTSWLGNDGIAGTQTTGTCTPINTQPIQVMGISPHMHLTGKHMKSVLKHGSTTTVIHDADFAFSNQGWYKKWLTVMPGDTISVRCDYTAYSTFGEKTTDEMCYMFTVAYPKGALTNGQSSVHGDGTGNCLGNAAEGVACGLSASNCAVQE
jgi:hypothetical protein